METRHQIALLTAGLLIGAQIGIAAIDAPIADTSDQMEPVPSEAQALEGSTSGEPMEAQSEATAVPEEGAQPLIAAAEEPSALMDVQRNVPQGTAFPPSTEDTPMLPSLVAYLERTEHLRVTGASGDVFPSSNEFQMLPALAAYLEQREATRLAAEMGQPVAGEATAAGASLDATTSETTVPAPTEQEPAREVSLLDRILPRALRDLF